MTLVAVWANTACGTADSGRVVDGQPITSSIDRSTEPTGAPDGTGVTVVTDGTVSYFDVARTSGAASDAMAALLSRALAHCMTARGFDYPVPPASTSETESIDQFLGRRYQAPITLDGVTGYSFDGLDAHQVNEPMSNEPTDGSLEFARAMEGSDTSETPLRGADGTLLGSLQLGSGCRRESVVNVFGSVESYAHYLTLEADVGRIAGESWSALRTDDHLIEMYHDWAECMAAIGFAFTNPFEAANHDWPSPRPGSEEQRVAAADAECRRQTDVTAQLRARESELQVVALQANPSLLSELSEAYRALISEAAVDSPN